MSTHILNFTYTATNDAGRTLVVDPEDYEATQYGRVLQTLLEARVEVKPDGTVEVMVYGYSLESALREMEA